MLVRLRGIMAGPNGVKPRGAIINVPDVDGQKLIDSRQADAVSMEEYRKSVKPEVERATDERAEARETAEVAPHRRKRRVVIDEKKVEPEPEPAPEPESDKPEVKDLGGGWFEVDGEKVHGKKTLEERLSM